MFKRKKMNIRKVMAVLAQPKKAPPPLKNVEQRRVDIPYITKENSIDKRPVRLYIPNGIQEPMPLIFVPHYEMGEDALELRDYLNKGWMVASPTDVDNKYNGQLVDDDLVFNNAALYTLRNLPEVDKKRIALVGGSAGGYMTLMLNALQLGICCSIANCPITNTYFNFYAYFLESEKLNDQAMAKRSKKRKNVMSNEKESNPLKLLKKLMKLPIPILAGISGMFKPVLDNFPNPEDFERLTINSQVLK